MSTPTRRLHLAAALIPFLFAAPVAAETATPAHGVSMHGDLKYGPDATHFDYANPNAPKGGSVTFSAIGTFDSLNPYILKGVPAAALGLIFETLTHHALDEPFSEYGLLAESIEMPDDRSWVAFNLRPEARWHDGEPVTVEDVIFSFETLKTKGHPFYRAYYANVVSAEKTGERRVSFTFEDGINRELPLIMGQLPVLPKHFYETREFDKTTLEPPLGSGPYRISKVDAGRSIAYERVPDYWGADIFVNRGRFNFDDLRYEYYRDTNVALEAFKAGEYDFRQENTSKLWATAYTGRAFDAGWIVKEELPDESDSRMQGWVFNTRREIFRDPRVRHALGYAFDFEWTNKTLFYGAYSRIRSYFSGSELASSGLPQGRELDLLEPFRDRVPPEVFEVEYVPPVTDGTGNIRRNLRTALGLLKEAGWEVRDGKLTNLETGEPMSFEILLVNPSFERITGPFVKNLERLGVEARVRTVDTSQYTNRMDAFDFDMTVAVWGQSQSPGNEQRDFWGSEAAGINGSRNLAGIEDPVVDALIDAIIRAETREDLVAACRALDRVLLWGHYVIAQWQIQKHRIAYWNKFDRPGIIPPYGLDIFAWWIDPVRVAELENGINAGGGAQAAEPD